MLQRKARGLSGGGAPFWGGPLEPRLALFGFLDAWVGRCLRRFFTPKSLQPFGVGALLVLQGGQADHHDDLLRGDPGESVACLLLSG